MFRVSEHFRCCPTPSIDFSKHILLRELNKVDPRDPVRLISSSDLMMGAAYYPAQVGFLTGWIHHAVYLFIVEAAIRCSWTHIFCLCASMEVSFKLSALFPL
jgi:hypothetical protein